jgi:hypothetical protein
MSPVIYKVLCKRFLFLAVLGVIDLVKASMNATDCVAGEYFVSHSCIPCPVGSFQAIPAQESCRVCPQNMTTSFTGAATFTDCVCAAGNQMSESGQICVPCPEKTCMLCKQDEELLSCGAVLRVGRSHACILFPCEGKVKCWGEGHGGKLASAAYVDDKYNSDGFGFYTEDFVGVEFAATGSKRIKDVQVSTYNTCVLFEDGTAKCYGKNSAYEAGQSVRYDDIGIKQVDLNDDLPPIDFGSTKNITQIRSLKDATCALFDDHEVICWGLNWEGRLSNAHARYRPQSANGAKSFDFGPNLHAVHLFHTGLLALGLCARLNTGDVKCWGLMDEYGYSWSYNAGSNILSSELDSGGKYIMHIDISSRGTICYLFDDHTVSCSGTYLMGSIAASPAIPVNNLTEYGLIQQLSTSEQNTCVRFVDFKVICWSNDESEEGAAKLGIDTSVALTADPDWTRQTNRFYVNVDADDATKFVTVVVGQYVTCGILANKIIKCWGESRGDGLIDTVGYFSESSSDVALGKNLVCFDPGSCGDKVPVIDLGVDVSCCFDHSCPSWPSANCAIGAAWDFDDSNCVQCGVDSYKDVQGIQPCTACPNGTYQEALGESHCLTIFVTNSSMCIPGEYFEPVKELCRKCPIATFQPLPAQIAQTSCHPCPNGTYQQARGGIHCTANFTCDLGEYFHAAIDMCQKCPVGTFQTLPSATICIACPTDFTTAFPGGATTCVPYEYPSMCIPGEYFDSVSHLCRKCDIGTFQALPAQTSCRACPINHTTAFLGGAIYTDCVCPAMSYKDSYGFCEPCKNESVSLAGQTFCTCPQDNSTEWSSRLDCTSVLTCIDDHCCLMFPCLEKVKCWGSGPTGYNSDTNIGDGTGELGENLPFLPFDNVKGVTCHHDATCLKFHQDGSSFFRCFGKNDWGSSSVHTGLLMHGDDLQNYGYSASDPPVEQTPRTSAYDFNEFELLDLVHGQDFSCFLLSQTANVNATGGRLMRKSVLKCFGNRYVEGVEAGGTDRSYGIPVVTKNHYTSPQDAIAIDFGSFLYPIQIFKGGRSSACARMQTGDVKCWGYNYNQILGRSDVDNPGYYANTMGDNLPALFANFGNERYVISVITIGVGNRCVLMDDGNVKCWGYPWDGIAGVGNTDYMWEMGGDVLLNSSLPVKQVALTSGESNAAVLFSDGTIKAWGVNGYGQLGYGDYAQRGHTPNTVGSNLPSIWVGAPVVNLQGFHDGFCALTAEGPLKCWGSASATLAHGDMVSHNNAETVPISDIGEFSQYPCFRTNFDFPCAQNCKEGVGWNVEKWHCVPCTPGTYSDMGDTSKCQLCPPNTYSTAVAATMSSTCTECDDFASSPAGSSACLCITGYGKFS